MENKEQMERVERKPYQDLDDWLFAGEEYHVSEK